MAKIKAKYFGLGVIIGAGSVILIVFAWAMLNTLACDGPAFDTAFSPLSLEEMENWLEQHQEMQHPSLRFTAEIGQSANNRQELHLRVFNDTNDTKSLLMTPEFALFMLYDDMWHRLYISGRYVAFGIYSSRNRERHLLEPDGYIEIMLSIPDYFGRLCRGEYVIEIGWLVWPAEFHEHLTAFRDATETLSRFELR